MIHEILPVGLLACNCLIFGDEVSSEALVADPGDNVKGILDILSRHKLTVKTILLTHAHVDHVGGAAQLRAATGAPVWLHEADLTVYDHVPVQAEWLGLDPPELAEVDAYPKDGDILRLGEIEFHVLHTPGHSPGGISLWIPSANMLAAGDTLFRESIGRTDLPGGDGRLILESIRQKYLPLPGDTVVVPGHGPTTTLAHEKKFNYFLQRM
jgi:glyoxylase-like metal-dependent hydrolase (beta-lactamase superfamily II)